MALPLVATAFAGAVSYVSGKIVSDLVFKAVCWAFLIFVVGVFIAFITVFLNACFVVYYLIVDFLNFIGNSNNNTSLNSFFGVVSCSGVLGGINATKGLVLSALVFRLSYAILKRFALFFAFLYFGFTKAIGARLS
ncbi:MAG: hypothetical protein LBG21_01260 [Campylobacteraceae bacterium]|jgi:hypothetical protein|nr:hypothetical protein [Campylobacteraceae bacterium]